MRPLLVTLYTLLWLGVAGAAPGDESLSFSITLTPAQRAMLDNWLLIPYCEALVSADLMPPDGMSATLGADGYPTCAGAPTARAREEFLRLGFKIWLEVTTKKWTTAREGVDDTRLWDFDQPAAHVGRPGDGAELRSSW